MGEAILLRDVVADDLPIFFEHQRDPEAVAMSKAPSRDHDAFMEHWRRVLGNPSTRTKTVVVDGDVVGNVSSWDADGERVVGYWVARTHWGRGIATAALASFVRDYETTRPVFAYVFVQNVGSVRVLEKCGFRRVGGPITASDGVVELRMALASNAVNVAV
ncbi:MAG TPA: GNAT family N-acetyltransferase [Polyangiaceae bacterium]|nr:GNAT family N-acetyltransferase [Polyangiaceae bacterium]